MDKQACCRFSWHRNSSLFDLNIPRMRHLSNLRTQRWAQMSGTLRIYSFSLYFECGALTFYHDLMLAVHQIIMKYHIHPFRSQGCLRQNESKGWGRIHRSSKLWSVENGHWEQCWASACSKLVLTFALTVICGSQCVGEEQAYEEIGKDGLCQSECCHLLCGSTAFAWVLFRGLRICLLNQCFALFAPTCKE